MAEQDDWISRVEDTDISVFEIKSQTTDKDKRSLLTVQNFLRAQLGTYGYLEVGSYRGGSLVPHLVDPACTAIASIDPRPDVLPDERGRAARYDDNSTEAMIEGLAQVVPLDTLGKLKTYDCDAGDLSDYPIEGGFNLAMIDGEHTNAAAFRDFVNIRKYMAKDSIVLFHDSNLVFDALQNIETLLRAQRRGYRAYYLPGILFALVFGKLMKPSEAVLGPLAREPGRYLRRARKQLHERIARHWNDQNAA